MTPQTDDARMRPYWLKIDVNLPYDEKVRQLTAYGFKLWIVLLCLAKRSSTPGVIRFGGLFKPSGVLLDLAGDIHQCHIPGEVDECLNALERLGMIVVEGQTITIPNWGKWQDRKPSDSPERVAGRKKKWKEKHGRTPRNAVRNAPTDSGSGTPRNATDVDVDQSSSETEKTRIAATPKSVSPPDRVAEGGSNGPGHDAPRTPTNIQQVIEAYKILRHLASDPAQDRVLFPRLSRAAKQLLAMTGGDVALSTTAMREISGVLEGKGLDWRLDTVVREYPEWAKDTGHTRRPT